MWFAFTFAQEHEDFGEGRRGLLRKAMSGIRDVAQRWELECAEMMVGVQASIVQRACLLPRIEELQGGCTRRRLQSAWNEQESGLASLTCSTKDEGEVQGQTGER